MCERAGVWGVPCLLLDLLGGCLLGGCLQLVGQPGSAVTPGAADRVHGAGSKGSLAALAVGCECPGCLLCWKACASAA